MNDQQKLKIREELIEKLDHQLFLMVKMGMTDSTSTLSFDLTIKEIEIIIDGISKIDELLKKQREGLVEKGNGLKKIHDENWSPYDLRYNKAITDYQNLIKQ